MDGEIEAEFRAVLRRAGLHVPPERMAAMLDAYRALQEMLLPLAEPLGYADEPATWLHLGPHLAPGGAA